MEGYGANLGKSAEMVYPAWTVGLQASPYESPTLARFYQARIGLWRQKRAYEQKRLAVARDIRQTISRIGQLAERIDLRETEIERAEKEVELAVLRYQKGMATSLEVVDAESGLVGAQQSHISACVDLELEEINLKRLMGMLYSVDDL
jgi:outer membrane protein TolC